VIQYFQIPLEVSVPSKKRERERERGEREREREVMQLCAIGNKFDI
jgi:hypothetical protein